MLLLQPTYQLCHLGLNTGSATQQQLSFSAVYLPKQQYQQNNVSQ
jgi:hypothetical protein